MTDIRIGAGELKDILEGVFQECEHTTKIRTKIQEIDDSMWKDLVEEVTAKDFIDKAYDGIAERIDDEVYDGCNEQIQQDLKKYFDE